MNTSTMNNIETANHLIQWVKENHGPFSWPTDTCGYEQHVKFVEHRNKNYTGSTEKEFNDFVLEYAKQLTTPTGDKEGKMNLNEPAMPFSYQDDVCGFLSHQGLSFREYAAIHLFVPDSGNDELNAMIRRAQRERLAGKMAASIIQSEFSKGGFSCQSTISRLAHEYADAVIAAGEVKP